MLVSIDGHVISTESIVRIFRMHEHVSEFTITLLGPTYITISRNSRVEMPVPEELHHPIYDWIKMSQEERDACDAKTKPYYDECNRIRQKDCKSITLIIERLIEVWQGTNPKILVIDDKPAVQ